MPTLHSTDIYGQSLWPSRDVALDDLMTLMVSTPNLPGAACRGHVDLFDAAVGTSLAAREAQRQAVEVCRGCPVLAQCTQWAAELPDTERRALGVVGGVAPAVAKPERPRVAACKTPRATNVKARDRQAQRQYIEAARAARRAARVSRAG